MQQLLTSWRFPDWLAESIAATTAAQITTLPIMLYYFHTLGLYSILANVLVEPFIPLITLSGPPFFIISSLFESAGVYISTVLGLGLKYILLISKLVSALPHASIRIENIPLSVFYTYYLVILFLGFNRKEKY
jgi:competence protein ComEC